MLPTIRERLTESGHKDLTVQNFLRGFRRALHSPTADQDGVNHTLNDLEGIVKETVAAEKACLEQMTEELLYAARTMHIADLIGYFREHRKLIQSNLEGASIDTIANLL